ncbi:MAG: stage V sporulation T C-terminal domain-containing protein, partial [Oscillospiraceae bacterium]
VPKKEVLERRVSQRLDELMEKRKSYISNDEQEETMSPFKPVEGYSRPAVAVCPIIVSGDVCGSVSLLKKDEDNKITCEKSDAKLVTLAADFISKQMEQ